jgi:diaminopimelate epimerase
MKLTFYKYQGTGNDFVILDNRDNSVHLTNEQITFLCNRKFGIGADGLMLLQNKEGYDFEMIYHNADATMSMCGNGGRCMVKFAHHMGIHKEVYHFLAIDGPHEASIKFDDENWVRLKMKDVHDYEHKLLDRVLNTGSPHYVKPVTGLQNYNVVKEGRAIRYSDEYKEQGINVNFVEVNNEDKSIFVRTYERGVENETMSCGTGVTAAAIVFAHNDSGFNRVVVNTLGGKLAVEFDKETDKNEYTNVWLNGPATFVFKGEITL